MRNNSYITNLKYKLLRTPRKSTNEEPGNKIKQNNGEKNYTSRNSNQDNDNDDKVNIKANVQSVAQRN